MVGRVIARNRQFRDDVTESVKKHCMDQLMPLPSKLTRKSGHTQVKGIRTGTERESRVQAWLAKSVGSPPTPQNSLFSFMLRQAERHCLPVDAPEDGRNEGALRARLGPLQDQFLPDH
jgi:hypothetical protein